MRNRVWAIVFALVLVASFIPTVCAFADTTMYVYTSNGKSLNMRDYPSMDGNVITRIPYGAKVTVDDGFVGSSWAHVYYKNSDGYCMFRYLSTDKPSPNPQPTKSATP
ncbi:MAG TPA: SH3 domain-containing protein, partial [Candidatus Limiplasma sp.]|nr:SH3 domain-containing protein [Candidatus Limiplasma sp.]